MEKTLEREVAIAELCGAVEHLDSLRKSISFARAGLKSGEDLYNDGQIAAFLEVEDAILTKVIKIKQTLKDKYGRHIATVVKAVK